MVWQDALATGFEAEGWLKKGSLSYHGGKPTAMGILLAQMATQIILEDGLEAINDFKNNKITLALNRVIESTILLSGIGFESCHLAVPHALHNGLVELEATKR